MRTPAASPRAARICVTAGISKSARSTSFEEVEKMAELEIIGAPQSNYVCVTRIACREKGVPYTLVPARPHSPEVDAIHPFGRIPAMRHGDLELCESKAIATYIDRNFDGPKLI